MVYAIIVAAGSGKRMNSSISKQFIEVKNKPILAWTIDKFYENEKIDKIILAIKKDDEQVVKQIITKYQYKDIQLVYGGVERQDSILNCLQAISASKDDIVLIHDAVRPFVSKEIIEKSIEEIKTSDAVCVGMPTKDTIKIIDNNRYIEQTPQRDKLWIAQTPQGFKYEIIKKSYENAFKNNIIATDDSSLVEKLGIKVKMIQGDYLNIKITTPEDLKLADYILNRNED